VDDFLKYYLLMLCTSRIHTCTISFSLSHTYTLTHKVPFPFSDVMYIFSTNEDVPVDSIDLVREAKDEPCYKRLDPSVGATFAGLQRRNASSPSFEGTARGCSGRVSTCGLE
jgi:hypothetical protein